MLNRFDATLESELTAALRSAGADDGVRAVVLLAEGRAFSAGGDFELMLESGLRVRPDHHELTQLIARALELLEHGVRVLRSAAAGTAASAVP